MHRVLVIGGRGFLGGRVVAGLRAQPGLEVVAGSRGGGVAVDLGVPESFAAMDGFDTVVDCSDSLAAPPDAALAWCVARGKTFLETTAEPRTIERLLRAGPGGPGLAVVGVGLFPGVSNLL